MNYEHAITQAQEARQKDDLTQAHDILDNAYESLIKEAGDHAKHLPGALIENNGRKIPTNTYFHEADKWMRNHPMMRAVVYELGIVLLDMGQIEKARQMFKRAVELTPADVEFLEPRKALESLQ